MNNIYVSTIIDSYNYGTVLQAVATRDVLSEYGKPYFIDYCRPDWTSIGLRQIYLRDKHHNPAINLLRYCVAFPNLRKNKYIFRSFVERQLDLVDSTPYLEGGPFDANAIYCVGSDQTWNEELNKGIDPVYTLMHVPQYMKKFSFSASFGRPSIPDREATMMKPLLEQFTAISVRESSSVKILNDMGIKTGVALKDPVLLCRPQLWHELSENVAEMSQSYVLIYMLNENPRMVEYARLLASSERITVRIIRFNRTKPVPSGCEPIYQPSPEQWVACFRDAKYIVTDSFHGTCFSILFQKPMIVFNPPRYSIRLSDVLKDFGLTERRVADDESISKISIASDPIDWNHVNNAMSVFQTQARNFLKSVINIEP
ncbi:polysaccharide pyruvyl transferase family protein [Bifidobacterium vespertilionis]|uniref:Polysaccharide pyruvyl transferase family protein n=1 Tax=Bifidobacterium vespertilionis TaxID=2562524 RepID=A0A5J5DV95_9BIFI|nr:polysaccharide pyruvyl transferase family protein [Bifidobacterium vespertilionis]KAA8821802.1 polysaccharide pyruvyl transferase family protein [Bifidobacterium vespertilionis]